MPDTKLLPFRVIEGSKPAPAPAAMPEPEDPTIAQKAEVREILRGALEMCDDWTEVLVVFRSDIAGVDTCYSTLTAEDRHALLATATFQVLQP